LCKLEDVSEVDAVVIAVAHDEFKRLNLGDLRNLYKKYEKYDNDKNNEILEEVKSKIVCKLPRLLNSSQPDT